MNNYILKEIKKYSATLPFPQKVQGQVTLSKEGYYLTYSFKKKGEDMAKNITADLSPFPGFSSYKLEKLIENIPEKHQFEEKEFKDNPHWQFVKFQLDNNELVLKKEELNNNKLIPANSLKGFSSSKKLDCLKIKAQSKEDMDEVFNFIKKYKNQTASDQKIKLRIDPNASWDLEKLLNYYQTLSMILLNQDVFILDYFEEPLESFSQYIYLKSKLPYMHEEYLMKYLKNPSLSPFCLGGVVKPSQQGISVVSALHSIDKKIVVSSAFETPVALKSCKILAQRYPQEFHGLSAQITKEEMTWTE